MANKKLSSKCFYCIRDWTAKTTTETNLFSKDEIKESTSFSLYLNQVSNLECRPYLNEKIPQEHSILNIRQTSVVVSVWHVPRVACFWANSLKQHYPASFWSFLLLTLNIFHTFYLCFYGVVSAIFSLSDIFFSFL